MRDRYLIIILEDPHPVSIVDLWTFIVATSSYGGTFTILAMGKDGFGVNKDQVRELDTVIPIRRVRW